MAVAVEKRAIGLRVLITAASLVVVVAGLRAAEPIMVPVLFSAFLSILALPPIKWLQSRRVPDWLAVTIVFVAVIGVFALISMLIGNSIASFSENLPEYEARLVQLTAGWLTWLGTQGIEVSTETLIEQIDVGRAADLAGVLVTGIGSLLSNTVFVLLTTAFMLAEATGLPRKLKAALGERGDAEHFRRITRDIQEYLSIKTNISLATGLLAG